METKQFTEYLTLDAQVKALESQVTDLKKRRETLGEQLLAQMDGEGAEQLKVDGAVFYPQTMQKAYVTKENEAVALAWLRKRKDTKELVKLSVATQTLSKWWRDTLADLPLDKAEVLRTEMEKNGVKVYAERSLHVRRS